MLQLRVTIRYNLFLSAPSRNPVLSSPSLCLNSVTSVSNPAHNHTEPEPPSPLKSTLPRTPPSVGSKELMESLNPFKSNTYKKAGGGGTTKRWRHFNA